MSISMVRGAQLGALFLFGLVCGQASATDGTVFGMGAAANTNFGGASIYLPIRTGPLIIEPHISYSHNKDTTDGAGTGTGHYPTSQQLPDDSAPITSQFNTTNERLEIGLGLFAKNQIADEIEIYYGGRLGYLTNKSQHQLKDEDLSCCVGGGYVDTRINERDRKQTGYFLAPMLGLQYFPRPNFSLGIEISLRYSNLSGHESNTQTRTTNVPNGNSSSSTTSGNADTVEYTTPTAVVIRGYF